MMSNKRHISWQIRALRWLNTYYKLWIIIYQLSWLWWSNICINQKMLNLNSLLKLSKNNNSQLIFLVISSNGALRWTNSQKWIICKLQKWKKFWLFAFRKLVIPTRQQCCAFLAFIIHITCTCFTKKTTIHLWVYHRPRFKTFVAIFT